MDNTWKAEISRTILDIFRPYNGIDVLKLPFLEERYEKTFVVPYVLQHRFSPENLILAGMWPGPINLSRTYMAHFLKPVVTELVHLETGVAFYLPSNTPLSNHQIIRIRVYLIDACCDKSAQTLVQNIPERIAAFGCEM